MKMNVLRAGRVNKIENKVTRMIAVMIIGKIIRIPIKLHNHIFSYLWTPCLMILSLSCDKAFLVAWTPYSIFALMEQFGNPDIISPGVAVLPALIAKSSICYNPIVYVLSNSQVGISYYKHNQQIISGIFFKKNISKTFIKFFKKSRN